MTGLLAWSVCACRVTSYEGKHQDVCMVLSTGLQASCAYAVQALSLSKPKPPAPGKEGKVVKLKANHFKVMCNLKQVTLSPCCPYVLHPLAV